MPMRWPLSRPCPFETLTRFVSAVSTVICRLKRYGALRLNDAALSSSIVNTGVLNSWVTQSLKLCDSWVLMTAKTLASWMSDTHAARCCSGDEMSRGRYTNSMSRPFTGSCPLLRQPARIALNWAVPSPLLNAGLNVSAAGVTL